ncbi:MAG: glutamate 5-kinase [Pseudomonadota bacterium]
MQKRIKNAKRIVIKIGSALLVNQDSGELHEAWLHSLAQDVSELHKQGKEIVLVSSGSIALGRNALKVSRKMAPTSIPLEAKQAAASVGQIALMQAYYAAFKSHDITISQILLTPADTENRRAHLNARSTFTKLLDEGIIPIINENDSVATAEIRFGDNDRLAARVAQMTEADLLIQLSTTDGLYTADPSEDRKAEHIAHVEKLSREHFDMAGDVVEGLSTGGMIAKLEAAKLAISAGTQMIIAKGTDNNPIQALIDGARCTIFDAQETPGPARKRWIATHVKPKGSVSIDDGALKALKSGKSLLPAGVRRVSGDFVRGDAIQLLNLDGEQIGVGLSAYDNGEALQIIGKKSAEIQSILGYAGRDELIHRDDLVLQV